MVKNKAHLLSLKFLCTSLFARGVNSRVLAMFCLCLLLSKIHLQLDIDFLSKNPVWGQSVILNCHHVPFAGMWHPDGVLAVVLCVCVCTCVHAHVQFDSSLLYGLCSHFISCKAKAEWGKIAVAIFFLQVEMTLCKARQRQSQDRH